MKKVLVLGLALAAVASSWGKALTAADSQTTIGEARYVPVKWCSLGTSITWYDSHVSGAFTKGYQTRVMEQLAFDAFENVGVNGGCVNSAIGKGGVADLYTIEHGVNDWGNRVKPGTMADYRGNTGNGTFAANYRKVIDSLRAKNPKAKIVLCTPRKAYGFGTYLPANCDAQQPNGYYLKDYVEIVRGIAKAEKLPLADFYATCGEEDELKGLSIDVALHPNDAGYQRMANVLAKTVLALYPKAVPLAKYKPTFTDDGKPKDVEVKKFITSAEQVVLKGTPLAKVKVLAAEMGGTWIPGGPFPCQVHFEKYDAATQTYTCQLQSSSPQDACMRIVCFELKQKFNGDIVARAKWNRYKFNCKAYGTDFSVDGAYNGACASADNYNCQGYVIGAFTLGVNK